MSAPVADARCVSARERRAKWLVRGRVIEVDARSISDVVDSCADDAADRVREFRDGESESREPVRGGADELLVRGASEISRLEGVPLSVHVVVDGLDRVGHEDRLSEVDASADEPTDSCPTCIMDRAQHAAWVAERAA